MLIYFNGDKRDISESEFISIYKDFNINYIVFKNNIIQKIMGKISLGYLDITVNGDDSLGRQTLRSLGCNYKVWKSFGLETESDDPVIIKNHLLIPSKDLELVFVVIDKKNYSKFKQMAQSIINKAFNSRDITYFEQCAVLESILTPEVCKAKEGMEKENLKDIMDNLKKYEDNKKEILGRS